VHLRSIGHIRSRLLWTVVYASADDLGMNKKIIFTLIGLGLTFAGCSKDKDAPKGETATEVKAPAEAEETEAAEPKAPEAKPEPAEVKTVALKIEPFGIELDVPEAWEGKQLNDMAYRMRIASVKAGTVTMMPSFALMKLPNSASESLEEAATCVSGKLVEKKDLGEGKYFYNCELEVAGQAMFALEWVITLKEGGLRCSGSGPDISAMHAACESIREI
jgi:hypothetical protein